MTLEYRFDHRGNVELQNGQKHSYCGWYLLCFVLLQTGLVGWLYFSGYLTPLNAEGTVQALSLRGKMDEQERLLKKQAAEMTRLESQFISARRSEKIQQVANQSLREQLAAAESGLVEARERLLLYEEILSPQSPKPGLNVLHLGIRRLMVDSSGKKLPHNRYYQYHLILANINSGHHDTLVKGTFNLKVVGDMQSDKSNKPVTLTLQDIRAEISPEQPETAANLFSLKYYQGLEGSIELPEHFTPKKMIVELMPAAKQAGKKVTRQYDWNRFKLSAM